MIFITSDLHFGHNKNFIYEARGFSSIEEHDRTIISNWNSVINPGDEIYILGDLMLNNNEYGMKCLNQLNGKFHIILGNHDTEARQVLYRQNPFILDVQYATIIKYNKFHFYLSHFPTFTSNIDNEYFSQHLINLFGHTHSKEKFYNNNPFMYNVALDAHNNYPISIEQIIQDCRDKYQND